MSGSEGDVESDGEIPVPSRRHRRKKLSHSKSPAHTHLQTHSLARTHTHYNIYV